MRQPGARPVSAAPFDYEAKQWGAARVEPRPWYLQGLRLRYCLEDLVSVDGFCLDAGCGAGNMAKALKRWRPDLEVAGVDSSRNAIRSARSEPAGVRFEVAGLDRLPFPDSSFESVVMFDVLEHLKDPPSALAEIARVLKAGGLFHVALPLEDQPRTLHRFLRRRGWDAKLRHSGHVQAFDAASFGRLAAGAGLEVKKVRYSSHHLMTLIDVAYYMWLDRQGGADRSLDDTLAAGKTPLDVLLRGLKGTAATAGWFESLPLASVPGTCGHFSCLKRP